MSNYKTTVGIEVHAELKTKTKIFSDSANHYGKMANTCTNVIDLGYPGTLPTMNEEVIHLGLRAALVLNCEINKHMHFDRKNYFYPDNPKNYQITQNRTPIGVNGYVEIDTENGKKKIRIHDIHIEEDTCKSIHADKKSMLDYNRAGVPLVEIVTEADMNSAEEAVKYLEKLRELLLYADVSDCKIEEGSMRCDCNVSVSKTDKLNTKVEVKNIGSISNVGVAIKYEEERQIALYEKGETFKEQTRRFDDKTMSTILMRVKETGNDYRYFPEPDIPFVDLTDEYIKETKENLPMSAEQRREVYKEAGINDINVEKIIQNRNISDYLNKFIKKINLVIASNLLLGDIAAYLNKTEMNLDQTKLTDEKFEDVVNYLDSGKINSKIFKEILDDVMESNDSIDKILDNHNIKQMGEDEVIDIINTVIENNPQSVQDYKNGNERAIKFLMGQIMKETKGNANPQMVTDKLTELLNK
ncbi:MAG: Asp-tRNA(Asn)/Glu-tRNA(Gln) amidotransferase subunit GatB [Bacilli bacterium]|nr:Asp-tRNA(Asn)/Glu-tRNA(Gln) amidotransferase subunit GatB [Bacilli bacterium]